MTSASSRRTSGDAAGIAATGITATVEVARSLAGFVSGLKVETVAVLERSPGVEGRVTTNDTVADAPLAMVPRAQVTVAVPPQLPWLGVADIKVVPAGRTSTMATLLADPGPELVATIVYVTARPVP